MKRKSLESTICGLQDLVETINSLKQKYSDKDTQIDVLEAQMLKDCYYVTIWWVR